jgi:integrase
MASIKRRSDGVYRARYRDAAGKEHARHFERKIDAQKWLDEVTTSIVTGNYVDPKTARTTVGEWCDTWLAGYKNRRPTTVRAAKAAIRLAKEDFGAMPLSAVRPSHVRAWVTRLQDAGYAHSTIYADYRKVALVFADAVHDGLIPRSPFSRRTSPGPAKQRAFVATTDQVWALHDAMPEHLRVAVLLGAFVGLRTGEACGLRVSDVDFIRGIVNPAVQYPALELKTDASRTPVPIPQELALKLSAHVAAYPSDFILTDAIGHQCAPRSLVRAVDIARRKVEGLPNDFRFHDLRHYFASLLIAHGADVKVVQARLRHASATTTLNTYSHLWPDSEEGTRATVAAVLAARADSVRTGGPAVEQNRRSEAQEA